MLKIQRVLLLELLVVLFLITNVVTAAVFGGFAARFVMDGGGALGSELMLALMPKLIPIAVSYSLPFAWLATVALVLGRWVSDHEITALKAAGVSTLTVIAPVLAMGCLLSVASIAYSGTGVVTSTREVRATAMDFLPKFLNSLQGADRSLAFNNGRLSWDRFDAETREFVGAELDRQSGGRLEQKAIIERLKLDHVLDAEGGDGLNFDLKGAILIAAPEGNVQIGWAPDARFSMGHADRIAASTLFNEFFGQRPTLTKPRDMMYSEVFYAIDRGGVQRGSVARALGALHGRLVLGSAAFFLGMFALAAALALPPSSRRVRDFIICFVPGILIFFPLHLAGAALQRTAAQSWIAHWAPNLALATVSLTLFWIGRRR